MDRRLGRTGPNRGRRKIIPTRILKNQLRASPSFTPRFELNVDRLRSNFEILLQSATNPPRASHPQPSTTASATTPPSNGSSPLSPPSTSPPDQPGRKFIPDGRSHVHVCRKDQREKRFRSAEGWGEARRGEATDFIAFAFAFIFSFAFSAQKSRVKPQNHLNHTNETRSTWHVSYPQTAILDM
jgi:hypothetical protein